MKSRLEGNDGFSFDVMSDFETIHHNRFLPSMNVLQCGDHLSYQRQRKRQLNKLRKSDILLYSGARKEEC